MAKKSKVTRGDGIAKRGRTKGRMVKKVAVAPKRRSKKPLGLKSGGGFKHYLGGDEQYAYGGGELFYDYEKKRFNLTPSEAKKRLQIESFKLKPYITGSGSKEYKKSIDAQFDRIGLDAAYKSKKFDLEGRYSQDLHGDKNKRFNARADWRPDDKTNLYLESDADKRHEFGAAYTGDNWSAKLQSDLDKKHGLGVGYKDDNWRAKLQSDLDDKHGIAAAYEKDGKEYKWRINNEGEIYFGASVDFKHGGKVKKAKKSRKVKKHRGDGIAKHGRTKGRII